MNSEVALAILYTVCYADVFSFPLCFEELATFLVGKRRCRDKDLRNTLEKLLHDGYLQLIESDRLYIKLPGATIVNRSKRRRISQKKIRQVRRVIRYLSAIPTVDLIGVSGGVAVENATVRDDTDLFIIVKTGSLWITRLVIIIILEILGVRRKPQSSTIANKVCVNMVVDRRHLALPFDERDLFSAHEVIAMKPLFTRADAYSHFLRENHWVGEFMANSKLREKKIGQRFKKSEREQILEILTNTIIPILTPCEWLARRWQLWYMHRRRTKEVIQEGYLRFHPLDAREWILRKYRYRLARYQEAFMRLKTSRVSHPTLFEAG